MSIDIPDTGLASSVKQFQAFTDSISKVEVIVRARSTTRGFGSNSRS